MAQRSQIIDITKSYLPGDPNAFVQNLINTDREDGEEKTLPVLLFEGYNFLPTSYGYRSYFGVDPLLNIGTLPSRAQFIFSYQLPDFRFRLIALCEDGIWIADPGTANAGWDHVVVLSYDSATLEEWSHCIIENVLYMYRQADPVVYKTGIGTRVSSVTTTVMTPASFGSFTEREEDDSFDEAEPFRKTSFLLSQDGLVIEEETNQDEVRFSQINQSFSIQSTTLTDDLVINSFTPSFLNMAGQMGIFKAGTRLGFWDSANSVSWSSNVDVTDFTASIENLAGNEIFADTIGRIIIVKAHGEGFVVYATKSIVGATFDQQGNLLWDGKKILDGVGISYRRAVTHGQDDVEHIAWTTNGVYMIGKFNAIAGKHEVQVLIPEVYDFLRETRDPIWLDCINNRWILFSVLNPDYVFGKTAFSYTPGNVLNSKLQILGADWTGETLPDFKMDGLAAAEAIKQLVTFGFVSENDTSALWTIHSVETQDGTIGPLSTGGGSRNAETPGFTQAEIEASYITGRSLPPELSPIPAEHPSSVNEYLGHLPQGAVTVSNAMGTSIIKEMQKQLNDWKMFNVHQIACRNILSVATKTVNTAGTSIVYGTSAVTPPSATPAAVDEYVFIGEYDTGFGNIEIQKDEPLRRLILRKYKQQKYVIRRRRQVSYTWRQSGSSVAVVGIAADSRSVTTDHSLGPNIPSSFSLSFPETYKPSYAELNAALIDIARGQAPATLFNTPYGASPLYAINSYMTTTKVVAFDYNFPSIGVFTAAIAGAYTVNSENRYPWYLDTTETYSYDIQAVDADLGFVDWKATQVAYGRTTVQVTSNPLTVVVDTKVPIFPVGPSAATFFPRTWNGTETLRLIAASAYSPWHYVDGTFGIELLGDPVAGATDPTDGDGYLVEGSSSVDTTIDITYTIPSYLMQEGAFSIPYPVFEGAYVLDLHLKKWGKMKHRFYNLVDLNPVNQTTPNLLVARDMGMTAALQLASDSTLRVFDENPDDSVIRYGKVGHYRLGMCNLLETKALFRSSCTGILSIDASMDGRHITSALRYTLAYTNAGIVEALPDISARWFIVSLTGKYDLTGLETRDKVVSRR